jgi:LPS-assembly lipoprotein
MLAGCGFQPMYGSASLGAVDEELARVKVQVISDRVGQQAHNFLLDRLNRSGRPADPRYLLEVKIRVAKTELGIERDETATRAKLVLTANFSLTDLKTRETLLRRTARSTNSYNIVDSAVSTRSAELDAVERAAREISEDIRVLLSLYFRRRAARAGSS